MIERLIDSKDSFLTELPCQTEADRLTSLRGLLVLDTEPEAEFDALVEVAAIVCGMPISLISLVDEDRQWFKANTGLAGVSQTPRDVAFCDYTIQQTDVFEVNDCLLDHRFVNNDLVTGDPHLRFYAGAPLCLSDGSRVGSLCVLDRSPNTLNDDQRRVLQQLAKAASHALESHRTAKALIASELRFRTLCAASPLGVFGTDVQGLCTYTNSRWQSIVGCSAEQALGDGWQRMLHPGDQDAILGKWHQANLEQQELEVEFRTQRGDGQERMVRAISRPVLTDDGEALGRVGLLEDVTDHKAQIEQQRHSALLLRQTGELAQVGGWELDLGSGKLTWSEQACRIHGVAVDYEPQLETAIDFFTIDSRTHLKKAIQRLMDEGAPYDMELQLMRADGDCIWVRVLGDAVRENDEIVRLRGVIQNVDELIRQRTALQEAHERITLATDSGEIGVWEWRVSDSRLEWSEQMFKLHGIESKAGTPTTEGWMELLHPADKSRVIDTLTHALEGNANLDCDFRIIRKDGEIRHLRSTAHIKRDAQGKAVILLGLNWDVTAMRLLSSELAEQHELLQVTLQSIDEAVITVDTGGEITWMNPAAESLTGWACPNALGQPLGLVYGIVHEKTGLAMENSVTQCLREGRRIGHKHDLMLRARGALEYGIEDSATPILDTQGQLRGVVLVFRDVSEQRRLSQLMAHRATYDKLTQTFNRSEFEMRLSALIADMQEAPEEHALMFIDLDQFKLVNDTCGHPVGDQLLRQVAGILRQSIRHGDTLARLGGDEFGIILHGCDDQHASRIAQGICDDMNDFRFSHGAHRFRIGASIGLVPLDGRWNSMAAIMQAADTSCYAAKEAGRNRVHVWFDTDDAMRARRGDMQWATRLEQSLDENKFELHAQRLVAMGDGETGLNAEVLIRLRDDQGNLILPGAFLPAAERFHLATRLDRWVLQRTIERLADMPNLSGVELLWVNLSGQSVGDRQFHRDALQMLEAAGDEIRQRICLEITETAAVTNIADASGFIDSLRGLKVRTALDDFGSGASSFGYLKNLPVDILKLDGQFISNIISDPLATAAVRCFVEVAAVVGLKTVAEHVENKAVMQRVQSLGVDYVQGFLLHEPEPIQQVLAGLPHFERLVNA